MTAKALSNRMTDGFVDELRNSLGDRLSTAGAVREQHGRAEDYFPIEAPDAVCFVESTEEVAAIVALCARDGVPVIPYGTGTSLPVLVFALLLAFAAASVGKAFNILSAVECWVRRLTGGLFILVGLYYCLTHVYGIHL